MPAVGYVGDPRAAAIAEVARRLADLRDHWLNPPEWVERLDEPIHSQPLRPVPCDEVAAKGLETRTPTKLP